jgi:hypothetical protein
MCICDVCDGQSGPTNDDDDDDDDDSSSSNNNNNNNNNVMFLYESVYEQQVHIHIISYVRPSVFLQYDAS